MAITRAQQAKQMLQDGGMTKKIKGQEHMLAYITPGEADKLVELGGQETMTPEGIPAYPPSDYSYGRDVHSSKPSRTTTNNPSSNDGNTNRERYITNYVSKSKVKGGGKKVGVDKDGSPIYEDRDFSDKTDPTNREIIDRQRRRYQDQFTSKGIVPPGPNRKARQRALNYLNKNMLIDYNQFGKYYDPSKFGITKTGYPNFGFPNFYEGITAALKAGATLDEILENENMIPLGSGPSYEFDKIREEFNKADLDRKKELLEQVGLNGLEDLKGTSYEMNPIPDLDIDSIRELASTQTTMQGAPLTGYQAKALKELKEGIQKRDDFFKTGDTSDIFPPPPKGNTNDGPDPIIDPCKGPNPPAYCFAKTKEPEDPTPTRNLGGLAPRFAGSIFDFTGLADGGRVAAMGGGLMNTEVMGGAADDNIDEAGRQMYFLGKLVKKATRAVKKVAKSPFGKAALGAALFKFGGGFGGGKGLAGLKGKLFGMPKEMIAGPIQGLLGTGSSGTMGWLGKLGLTKGGGSFMPTLKGGLALGFGVPLALDLLGVGKDDDDKMDLDEYYRKNSINIADIRNNPYNFLAPRFAADGGLMRTGYQEGGDAEPVAKKTMPLIDMDGQEKDYRETGGFVDMGRMERADDVPARLSKNEFVFTADAVRNAGEGDIDKGAEVMYNMMKNLESGGEVSEESQGLDGAREMFQTSQRLEEVL